MTRRRQSSHWNRATGVGRIGRTIRLPRWPGNIVSVRSVESRRQTPTTWTGRVAEKDGGRARWSGDTGCMAVWCPVVVVVTSLYDCRLMSASIARALSTTFNKLTATSARATLFSSARQRRLHHRLTTYFSGIPRSFSAGWVSPAQHTAHELAVLFWNRGKDGYNGKLEVWAPKADFSCQRRPHVCLFALTLKLHLSKLCCNYGGITTSLLRTQLQ